MQGILHRAGTLGGPGSWRWPSLPRADGPGGHASLGEGGGSGAGGASGEACTCVYEYGAAGGPDYKFQGAPRRAFLWLRVPPARSRLPLAGTRRRVQE